MGDAEVMVAGGAADAAARVIGKKLGDNLGITTIGIGIQEDVSRVYKQSINIKKAEDLGVVSFKQIKLAV